MAILLLDHGRERINTPRVVVIPNGRNRSFVHFYNMRPEENTGDPSVIYASFVRFVGVIDRMLRRHLDIIEFSTRPECLFRLQITFNDDERLLDDGTELRVGDRLVDLHFWNEHIPIMQDRGPDLAFARRVQSSLIISLSELCKYLRSRADLDDVKAIRGNMSLGANERSQQISRLAARYGFQKAPQPSNLPLGKKLHLLGENILITLLVYGRNPHAIRSDTLRRGRTLAYISRRELETRFNC